MHTAPPPDPLVLTPEQAAWLRLTMSARVGPAAMAQLLKVFGLPTAVFAASQAALARVLGDTLARSLSGPPAEGIVRAIDITRQWLQAGQQRFLLTWADADYPQALLATPDAPPVLFGMGERALLRTPMLAIVGARSSTRQGEATATAFAQSLAQAGLTIVSGLARGIDAAAHEGALAARAAGARASTVAVLGTGVDVVYPRAHLALAERISAQGLLLSEHPLGTPPLAHHFPRRNRIIAGLARGILVVEAALRSGSLITARLGGELGREVFAIPGSIHSPLARGAHRLIRDGAKLVESAQDILEELQLSAADGPSAQCDPVAAPEAIETEAKRLLDALGHDPTDIDALSERTGMETGALVAALFELEMAQCIERLPGNRYQRLS